jgi:predicted AlkP superfamily phosphohydrolase/phosphomutase
MRVLVIGLDGATFDYLDPWIAAGELPALAGLLARAVRAVLRSTPSPYTNVAWPALVTGCHPGKTGVHDAAKRFEGSYDAVPTNLLGFAADPIWSVVGREGLRASIINVPMTYPPRPLNGQLVTGFDTPRDAREKSFPADLLDRLQAGGRRYRLLEEQGRLMASQNPHQPRGDVDTFVRDWVDLTSWQGELSGCSRAIGGPVRGAAAASRRPRLLVRTCRCG